ncbi:MAG: HlyC/CorC family transporter [Caldilineaceae bacterium]|nr:HlyC/CorC family transporter [Caldilineaceae bacterium]
MSDFIVPVLIIAFLILVNALFVAAEFGIAAAPRTRIQQLAETGVTGARRVLETLRSTRLLNRYISTAQVGITVASLGLGMYGEHAVAAWVLEPLEHVDWVTSAAAHTAATIFAVGLLTYLHVVVGEMVPKSLALQHPGETAMRLATPMTLVARLFLPFTSVLNWLGDSILRLVRLPPVSAGERLASSDELAYIVEESSERGLLERTEQVYLENVFDFHERSVGQVMTPRNRIVAIPVTASEHEVLETLATRPHSRYPLYDGDRDHIVGVLHAKDVAHRIVNYPDDFNLSACMRPILFAPETLSLEAMLQRFRTEHVQIALIVDEFGGTAGLVTLEDLAEEIIGEIQDEFDQEIAPIETIGERTLRVRGDLLLDELDQHFDLFLEHEEAETVGGLIMAELGRVPQPGDTVTYAGVTFTVEKVEGLAVGTAIVVLPSMSTEGID